MVRYFVGLSTGEDLLQREDCRQNQETLMRGFSDKDLHAPSFSRW